MRVHQDCIDKEGDALERDRAKIDVGYDRAHVMGKIGKSTFNFGIVLIASGAVVFFAQPYVPEMVAANMETARQILFISIVVNFAIAALCYVCGQKMYDNLRVRRERHERQVKIFEAYCTARDRRYAS